VLFGNALPELRTACSRPTRIIKDHACYWARPIIAIFVAVSEGIFGPLRKARVLRVQSREPEFVWLLTLAVGLARVGCHGEENAKRKMFNAK
jgi:hypothetical protein